jgi:hypothetical protein
MRGDAREYETQSARIIVGFPAPRLQSFSSPLFCAHFFSVYGFISLLSSPDFGVWLLSAEAGSD